MKKLILVVLFLSISITSAVWASPFLVCTVDPVVTSYLIKVNGAEAIEVSAPLHWDVGPLANGTYALEVAAKNMWGQSIYVPFDFTKKLPNTPLGIGLSAE